MIKNSLSWISLNASVGGGTGGTSDYNQLSNRPIKTLIGTAQNPIKLWKLETGLFILNGFIQHTNELVSEGKSLFVSVVAGLSNGKYVVAAFIPFWEGQYEYILNSLSSNNYNEHQIVMMISQDDVLTLDNEKEYTPTKDYHPSTKKYVDDMIVNFREELSEMGVNEENIESLMAENRRRDIAIQALLSQGGGSKTVTIEEETHTISLDYSIDKGMVTINTMEGSTLVNVATQKEKVGLSYGQDNTVNYSNEILAEQNTNVKPMLEGNTMVNYCNNGNISMGLNKEINVVDDTGKMITLDDTVDSGLVDVKIEGKTLVNLYENKEKSYNANYIYSSLEELNLSLLKTNTKYTVFVFGCDRIYSCSLCGISGRNALFLTKGDRVFTFDTPNDLSIFTETIKFFTYSTNSNPFVEGDEKGIKFILLEGDHTDKDISYFEGLKSVGQDSAEISIKSTTKNLFNTNNCKYVNGKYLEDNGVEKTLSTHSYLLTYTEVKPFMTYIFNEDVDAVYKFDKDMKFLGRITRVYTSPFVIDDINCKYIGIQVMNVKSGNTLDEVIDNLILTIGDVSNNTFTSHKSNKKQILYYNPITQTWEKPVLREWDSIEKHSDGKYYYHKRSGEVTLSEKGSYLLENNDNYHINVNRFKVTAPNYVQGVIIVDKIKVENTSLVDYEVCVSGGSGIYINILKSKAQDTAGFKVWLQANPVTVVYQLAQEEIYECTNLSLDTYSNQTNIFNNSLIPCNMEIKNSTYDCILFPNTKYTVKLDSNISNDIQVNLGGTVSTINSNIFEITTPNELTNESLTLYGNGEIVNNAMLFYNQDDITTYEYFTGLKSCFEEELVTDENSSYYGKYRVKYDSGVDNRTFYLNSPLLKGDRIEEKNGKLYHYHNMGKVVINGSESGLQFSINKDNCCRFMLCRVSPSAKLHQIAICDRFSTRTYNSSIDIPGITIGGSNDIHIYIDKSMLSTPDLPGFKTWLQANPTTVVYELAEPYYEEISSSQKLIKSSSNNKLTFNTNIPLTSIQLKPYEEELTYLYKSTAYTVQFEADNNCLVNVTLGGTKLLNQSIVAGLNKIQITTPSTLLDNKLRLDVIGSCNISELVVTNSIQEFEYFEGMKSSFEDTPNDEAYNAEIIIYNAPVRFGKGGRL